MSNCTALTTCNTPGDDVLIMNFWVKKSLKNIFLSSCETSSSSFLSCTAPPRWESFNFQCREAATMLNPITTQKPISLMSSQTMLQISPRERRDVDGLIYFLSDSPTEHSRGSLLSHYAQDAVAGSHMPANASPFIQSAALDTAWRSLFKRGYTSLDVFSAIAYSLWMSLFRFTHNAVQNKEWMFSGCG